MFTIFGWIEHIATLLPRYARMDIIELTTTIKGQL